MIEFGTYKFMYLPPQGAIEAKVSVSISSEADLSQMMKFFEDCLKAVGFQTEDKTLTLEREEPVFSFVNPAGNMVGGSGPDYVTPYGPNCWFSTDSQVSFTNWHTGAQ